MVNNSDGSDWVDISAFLNDPGARALFRQQAAQFLSSGHYHGLMIDFEAFPDSGQPGYVALLQELGKDLHANGMKLYVAVPPHNEEFDYASIAAAADGVILMNYDEHYPGAASGPVASQDWFDQNLKYATTCPAEKQDHLRDRQLRLRLGVEAEEWEIAARGARQQCKRAGCMVSCTGF